MRVVRVRGLKEYRINGKLYRYHRASGKPIDTTLSDTELVLEIARLDREHKQQEAKAGTLGGLFESYRKSPRYTDLAERTKRDYLAAMNHLKPIGDTPLTLAGPGFFAKLRDKTVKIRKTGFTNHMLAMLSSAFQHGTEYELVERNPLAGLAPAKMPNGRKKPNRAWTPEERVNVMAVAWEQLRLPIALAMYLGLRRGDIVDLPVQAYKDGWLTLRARKNDALLRLPVLGALKDEIDAALARRQRWAGEKRPADLMLCLNTRGRQWTRNGLSVQLDKFFEECRERGLMGPGGSLHGLRHSVGAMLRGAGYDKEMRKLILGHDTDDMAEHYSASADMTGKLIDMVRHLDTKAK